MVAEDATWKAISELLADAAAAGETPVAIVMGRKQVDWALGVLKRAGRRRSRKIFVANLPVIEARECNRLELEILASLEDFMAIERAFQKDASGCQ
jgi:hypothetical protein